MPGIPRARGADVVEGELDEGSRPEAERRRRFAVAEMLRNGRTTVTQRLHATELCRRGGVGFEAALELGDRRRGRGGEFKGRSRGSRARLGKGIPGGFAGDLGGPSRGEDDPARRARRVSETGSESRQRALVCGPGADDARRGRAGVCASGGAGLGAWALGTGHGPSWAGALRWGKEERAAGEREGDLGRAGPA